MIYKGPEQTKHHMGNRDAVVRHVLMGMIGGAYCSILLL